MAKTESTPSSQRYPRHLRVFYLLFYGGVAAASGLLAIIDSSTTALFVFGFGSLAVATAVALADTDDGKGALVRNDRLTRLEKRTLMLGLLGTSVAACGIFAEIAAGGSGWDSAIFAVTMAASTGGFAVVVAVVEDPIQGREEPKKTPSGSSR